MYIFRVKPHIGYILQRHNRYMFDIFVCCILLRRVQYLVQDVGLVNNVWQLFCII